MESEERVIPLRRTARKVHARLLLRSRLRRRAFLLEVIDYYFLSVQIWRAQSLASEYVLDLRFIDPNVHQSRHVAWRWIGATLGLVTLLGLTVWWAVSWSSAPWWQADRLAIYAILLVLALGTGFVGAYRTWERWALRSVHGKAEVLACLGGLGTHRAMGAFAAKLAAHVRIAVAARRSSKGEHLRDEMREHFRLKEAGVLSAEAYEAGKMRILGTHTTTAAAAR